MFEVNLCLWYYIISKTQILGGNKMENLPNCPKCNSEYTYEDGSLVVCPECGYEWNPNTQEEENVIKDVNGNVLNDGDSVTVVKDLKVKGASSSIRVYFPGDNFNLCVFSSS